MAIDTTIGGDAADSYVTLAEWAAYATAMGWTLTGTDPEKEANLRRAAVYIDATYSFIGQTQYQTQALEWPRIWTGYVDGWPINPDTVPAAVKNAQMEMAYLIQGGADPLANLDGVIARKRSKAGPVETETEYLGGKGLPRYTVIDRLLRQYLRFGGGQVAMVRG